MQKTCPLTGKTFAVSEHEKTLRKKLGLEGEPQLHPVARWRILGAFWQHWALHKRKCDRTGKPIVSVFSADCPYPVWHKDEWMKHADPPSAEVDPTKPVFPQMWELFRRSPIPHNVGTGNENCEYTDDWWYCKNCYLCHCGYECEDLRYCYRVIHLKNAQFCSFAFDSERCIDLVNSHHCFRSATLFNCGQCSESAFLYDCRNCQHCMFCSNLRNKSYCFDNEQLTRETYERKMKEWNLRSRKTYERGKEAFFMMLRQKAWHRALFNDQCQNVTGNYMTECKDCENCFFLSKGAEDCVNCWRSGDANRDALDSISLYSETELVYNTSLPQDHCYDIRCSHNVVQCKFTEYCEHCFQCEHCFGCCGLVGKKYCIFNKPYSPDEYGNLKAKIIAKMKETDEYGRFFPGYFAANTYEESLSDFYWPLNGDDAARWGFRTQEKEEERIMDAVDASQVPDRAEDTTDATLKTVYWDPIAKRPFQILKDDIAFAKDLGVPLPHTYYMRRLQDNFRLIPFTGELRTTACGKCRKETRTSWPAEYDGRILCESCYLKEVY